MGWWSGTVMGGDTPLDAQADLVEACGVKYEDFQDKLDFDFGKMKTELEDHMNDMIMRCESHGDDYRNISFQVMGVMLMGAGVAIPASVKKKIIYGARADEWAESSGERRSYMDVFIKQVAEHDGVPTKVAEEGLFEKFQQFFEGKLS